MQCLPRVCKGCTSLLDSELLSSPRARNEAFQQLYEINSPFLQTASLDLHHRASLFFNDQAALYVRELAWLQATGAELKSMAAHRGGNRALWMRAS